eukprot:6204139-Pleurochrysis_carterae.AAC.1
MAIAILLADRYVPFSIKFRDFIGFSLFRDCVNLKTFYRIEDNPIRSAMISNDIVTSRPEQAIMSVLTRFINVLYRLIRD